MYKTHIPRQMLDFNKRAFDSALNAMIVLQDQTEKVASAFVEGTPWLPSEGKKVIAEWVKSYKNGFENFKTTTNENYKKVADYFVVSEEDEKTKTRSRL